MGCEHTPSPLRCVFVLHACCFRAPIRALAVHPSGRFALSTGDDKTLRMWNLIKGKAAAALKLDGPGTDIAWSPNCDEYAVAVGATVVVYSVATGKVQATLTTPTPVNAVAFLNEDLVAIGSGDTTLRVFSIATSYVCVCVSVCGLCVVCVCVHCGCVGGGTAVE